MPQKAKETVLYYAPQKADSARILKGILVRMGVRIRNAGPEQAQDRLGALLGLSGFAEAAGDGLSAEGGEALAAPAEPMLILHGFGRRRLEELLQKLRREKAPPIPLKAMVTETNAGWTLAKLYRELCAEREKLDGKD